MAKAKQALSLWKGSAGSKTYTVLDGMQIIKDKVANVANPQTSGQMVTRVAFSTVAKAGAALTDLIGISFQGITKRPAARRRFNGINISKLAQQLSANAADGCIAPKGFSVLVPNKYIVADGSLRNAQLGTISVNQDNDGFEQSAHTFDLEATVDYSAAEIINIVFGCAPGDQITTVGIRSGVPVNYYPEDNQILRDGDLVSQRVYFKTTEELAEIPAFTFAADATAAAIAASLSTYIKSLFKTGATALLNLLTAEAGYTPTIATVGGVTTASFSWTVATASGGAQTTFADTFGGDDVVAIGYFRSHLSNSNMWMFSRCALVVYGPEYTAETYQGEDAINYGCSYALALPTYVKSSARQSTRYTETGGSANSLGF